MSTAEKQTAERVLRALSEEPLRPSELVDRLRSTTKDEERLVRRVVWSLLDSGEVALRHDRKLEAARVQATGD
jgi:hypothetical protein